MGDGQMSAPSASELRRIALGMLGPADTRPQLDTEGWSELDALFQIHRLQPHLHGCLKRSELVSEPPQRIAANWARAHRSSAISALAHRAELFALTKLLSEHGIVSIALKGAFLAWYAYPAAAERPVRDLDILVPADQANTAFSIMLANRYESEEDSEAYSEHHRHKPPLLSKSGVRIELHSALQDNSTLEFEREVIAGRIRSTAVDDPASYPAASDMLIHLILHAAYGEIRLDVGPLLLSDVDYMIGTVAIDWPNFWQRCAGLNITRGAALVLAITDRWRNAGLAERCAIPMQIPDAILEAAPDLLLQDPATRKSARLLASLGDGPIPPAKRILAQLTSGKSGGYAKWLRERLGQSISHLANEDVRRTGTALSEVGGWLESAE